MRIFIKTLVQRPVEHNNLAVAGDLVVSLAAYNEGVCQREYHHLQLVRRSTVADIV